MYVSTPGRRTTVFGVALLFIAVISLGLLAGCAQTPGNSQEAQAAGTSQSEGTGGGAAEAYTFTDDLGNEVTVENPQRVVACMGSFANIWELAGGTLVGATDDAFDDYSITSSGVSKVGQFTAPNLEAIIALDPDFVIMTSASTGKDGAASQTELESALKASGITTAYFNVTTFDDYLRMLEHCCAITGRSDCFEKSGTEVKQAIDSVKDAVPDAAEAPTVLLMTTYSGGTRVQGSSTMTGAMLADLGAVNLADENKSLLKDFSLESVIEMNPDYILVVPMGNDDEAAMKNLKEATEANPAWATLDAVAKGNYVTLDKKLFLYKPNENWGESYQTLSDILYN